MQRPNLDELINTIANNHGVTVPAKNAKRKMRDSREGDGEATAQTEEAATSAPTDASMQLAQADTGVATEAAAGETAAGASGAPAAGEAAAGSGAAAGGGLGLGGLGLGGLALGGAALAGGGGGGGGAVAAAVNNFITGTIVAGPVLGGNGLKVEIYAANGTTKLGESTLDANGKFTVDIGNYTGIVIARVVDTNGGDDYLDEATGVPKDLNANLMAVGVVTGGTMTLNINPLTTIAAQKAGLAADGSGGLADATAVANANAAVADAFGLTNLIGTPVVATNGGSYDSTNGLSEGEKYGAILAALSGADSANSGDSQTIINSLVAAINVSGSTGTLSSAGLTLMLDGAATADGNVPGDAVQDVFAIITGASVDSSDVTAPNAPVIDPVAGDNVINAAEQTTAITGTAEANALVKLTLGGNTHNVVADGSGNWSYTLVAADIAAMGQGAETLSATATDAAGNTGAAGTRGITVDTTAPTQTVGSVDISADTGTSATDFLTSTAGQTITGTLSAALAAGDILYGSVDNGTNWTNITSKVTGTAISWDGATLSGSSSILFKVTDAAGNDSATTGSTAYVLDTTAPVFSSGASANFLEESTVTAYDATADGDTGVAYTLGGTDVALFAINASTGAVTFSSSPNYEAPADNGSNNVYDITVTATDAAGNAASQAVAITVMNAIEGQVAGNSVINLSTYGKLIAPVFVDGNWYYYWDRSGDVTSANTGPFNGGVDYTTHDVLDGIFNQDINGVTNTTVTNADGLYGTTDTYRYATLGGVRVALPTANGGAAYPNGIGAYQPGTAIDNSPAGETNPTYNDLLAIWDGYNGTGTGTGINGTPPGWGLSSAYWSATPSSGGHALVYLQDGGVYGLGDANDGRYVALQVL